MATYKRVSTDSLYIDTGYQRGLDTPRVKRMAANFDERLVGTLEVSQRNGTGSYAVFDGQHRLEAAKIAGIAALPCLVHKDLSPEDEAELFVELQRQRKTIKPLDRFRARLFHGDEIALEIAGTVEACGYSIATYESENNGVNGQIRAVAALENIYRRGNLQETLDLLADLWKGDPKSTDASLMEGLAIVQQGYGARFSDDARERLRAVSPTKILRRSVGVMRGGSAAGLVAAEIRKTAGLRGRPVKPKAAT